MNQQKFHIHIDAKELDPQLERILLKECSFDYKNFIQRQDSKPSYAPETHLTYKTTELSRSKQVFEKIRNYLEQNPMSMIGYVEYECVPEEFFIDYQDFNPNIMLPFRLSLEDLPTGGFREDEIHLTLDRDNSDQRVIKSLREMGLFSALRQKDYGVAEIFTVQGSCSNIQRILPMLITYLKQAGGVAKCTVKEEIIMRHWISSPDYKLPPIIQDIQEISSSKLIY
jgi:hypothetical protein